MAPVDFPAHHNLKREGYPFESLEDAQHFARLRAAETKTRRRIVFRRTENVGMYPRLRWVVLPARPDRLHHA